MYLAGKALKEHIVPAGVNWSMNEAVLTMGQATADNIPAQLAQIQYICRVPTVAMAEHVVRALDHCAEAAARLAHCAWRRDWVSKGRPGLANHAMARATYANLAAVGAPRFGADAIALANRIRANLGEKPIGKPVPRCHGNADAAGTGGGGAAADAAAQSAAFHLRRLHRVLLARADRAPVYRPPHACARAPTGAAGRPGR